MIGDLENYKEITDEEFIKNTVYNIIKSIDKQSDEVDSEKSDLSENLADQTNKEFSDENLDPEFENEGDKEFYNEEIVGDINEGSGEAIEDEEISLAPEENDNGDYDESNDTKSDSFDNIKENDILEEEDIADKNDSNVSDVFDLLTEDGDAKKSKSVNLPITDFGNFLFIYFYFVRFGLSK